MIRSLLDRKEAIVSAEEDKRKEEQHITEALRNNNYPMWAIRKAKAMQESKKQDTHKKPNRSKEIRKRAKNLFPSHTNKEPAKE